MSDNTTERTYCLVESGIFERLLKTYFMQAQSLLLFEHLLGHSDRPMFLSARKVCEVLGLDRNKLEQYRRKRIIKARAVNGQMMYCLPVAAFLCPYPAGQPSSVPSYGGGRKYGTYRSNFLLLH